MSKLKTLNGMVLVEEIKQEQITSTGILIPESKVSRTKLTKAKVVSVNTDDVPVKVNDIVYFRHGAGLQIMQDSKEYLILRGTELAVVEEV